MAAWITTACFGLLGLIAASPALAVPALEAGDILTRSGRAIRVLDGPLRSESVLTGIPLELSTTTHAGIDCNAGALVSDGDSVIVVGSQQFAQIDLATGSWRVIPVAGDPDVPNLHFSRDSGRIAFEPGGSFLLTNGEWNDRDVIRLDPATDDASVLSTLADPPEALVVADDGTILIFSSTAANSLIASEILEVDPLSGAVVLRVESSALGAGKAMAVAPNGDVLLGTSNYPHLSTYRVLRVDPQGGISTLSNSDIGSGPALDLIEALGVLADGDLVALSHRKEPGVICPDETVLLRVDDSSGDRSVLAGVGVGTGPELSSLSAITVTPDGAILAIEAESNSILSIDAATGDREVVFDPEIGGGVPVLSGYPSIAIDPQRRIAWGDGSRILWVDPTTGERSVLAGDGVGGGDALTEPLSMVFAPDGDLLMTLAPSYWEPRSGIAYCRPKIFRVDTDTGDRSVISGSSVGAGPRFECPRSLAMGADGYLYVLNSSATGYTPPAVLRVDLANGNRAIVSDPTHGSGPLWGGFISMAGDARGSLYGADVSGAITRLLRVDAGTGARSILSGDGVGTGEALGFAYSIAMAADGSILVNNEVRTVLRVDPVTGDRTVLFRESGSGLAVVPALAPEPGTAALALVTFATLAARTRSAQSRRGERRQH